MKEGVEAVAGAGSDAVGDAVSSVAGDAFETFVQRLADGTQTGLQHVLTVWMKAPSPELATGSGQSWKSSPVIESLHADLMPVTAAFAIISFALALLRIGMSPERVGEGLRGIGRQLLAVVLATLPALAMTMLLLEAGDEFSPWLVERAAGGGTSDGFATLMKVAIASSNAGIFLIVFLIALLGSVAQLAFMYVRGAALIVLFVLLPIVAAGSATEEGWLRLKKLLMLILGFVLYKPVAAIIYATGLRLVGESGSDDEIQNAIFGMAVICMAALALPAFIKFVMPAAGAGSSSAFSGAGAIGAVAAGAAVVGLAGGGAGAAASASGAKSTGGLGLGGSSGGGGGSPKGSGDSGAPAPGAQNSTPQTSESSAPPQPEGGTSTPPQGSADSTPPAGNGGQPPAQSANGAKPPSGSTSSSTPPQAPPSAAPGAPSRPSRGGQTQDAARRGAESVRRAGDDAAEGAEQ
ncbi:hypothetical protein [Nocardioides pacificus]